MLPTAVSYKGLQSWGFKNFSSEMLQFQNHLPYDFKKPILDFGHLGRLEQNNFFWWGPYEPAPFSLNVWLGGRRDVRQILHVMKGNITPELA